MSAVVCRCLALGQFADVLASRLQSSMLSLVGEGNPGETRGTPGGHPGDTRGKPGGNPGKTRSLFLFLILTAVACVSKM